MNSLRDKIPSPIKIVIFILVTSCSLLTWRIYGQLNNTLGRNGQWTSSKIQLEKQVNGAYEYFYWLQALAHEKLDLGAWYGYQELISRNPVQVKQIALDYYLSPNSYIDIIYNKNPQSYHVFRVSSNPLFPPSLIKQKNTGEFESVQKLSTNTFIPDKWHHLVLDLSHLNQQVTIYTNHQVTNTFSFSPSTAPVLIGFRGSHKTSFVDNLVVRDSYGKTVFQDNFSFHDKYIILKLVGIFATFFLIHFFNKKTPFKTIVVLTNILFLLIVTTGYLHFFYVNRYPNPNSLWSQLENKLRQYKDNGSTSFSDLMNQEILNSVEDNQNERIIFLGTSQTWGAGASKNNETYIKVLESIVLPKHKIRYQFINAGISGSNSTEILKYYRDHWLKLNPKIVLIDLSSNDTDPNIFTKNLNEIVDLNKKNNIQTIFLLEANSVDTSEDPGLPLHEQMISLASSENIKVINIHQYLRDQQDSGNLWWDKVHPTTFGHRLLGEYVYNHIKDFL